MLERIIVGFDASDLAREALACAAVLAERTGCRIVGLFAREPIQPVPTPGEVAPGLDPGPAMAQMAIEMEEAAAEREAHALAGLREFADRCKQRGAAFEQRVRDGALLPTIIDEAGADDLIAVGRTGRFSRAGVGSTTKALVTRAPCPVLIVSGALQPIERIVCVYDGESASKRALAWAREIAEAARWPLTALAVASSDERPDGARAQAAALAGEGAEILTFADKRQSEAELIERASGRAGACALLVVGAYERSWLRELLLGGATAEVVRSARGPIVLVH